METFNFKSAEIAAELQIARARLIHEVSRGFHSANPNEAIGAIPNPIFDTARALYAECKAVSFGTITLGDDLRREIAAGYKVETWESIPDTVTVEALSFDIFMLLPTDFGNAWVAAVEEVNPQWKPGLEQPLSPEEKKRA